MEYKHEAMYAYNLHVQKLRDENPSILKRLLARLRKTRNEEGL